MRRPALATTAVVPVLLVLAACTGGTAAETTAPESPDGSPSASVEQVEFAYEGERGPEHWAELSPDFAQCADASAQSPVDLAGATPAAVPDPDFRYVPGPVTLTNTTHTVQATEGPGSTLVLDGHSSTLAQFHLHEPAEHTVDGVRADAELHLVHKDEAGAITVVGVMLRLGASDPALDPYLAALPTDPGATAEAEGFDPATLLPAHHGSFRYTGSLTTPPCTEGVTWVVLDETVEVSQAQLDAFRAVIDVNNRPVQDLGDRALVRDSAGS